MHILGVGKEYVVKGGVRSKEGGRGGGMPPPLMTLLP